MVLDGRLISKSVEPNDFLVTAEPRELTFDIVAGLERGL